MFLNGRTGKLFDFVSLAILYPIVYCQTILYKKEQKF